MQAQVALLLLGLHTASAYTSSDANGDGTVTTAEADVVYKQNYLRDYHVYPFEEGATKGRQGFYCPNVTVLQDTAGFLDPVLSSDPETELRTRRWKGSCTGLAYNSNATTERACALACYKDMRCAVWQWSGDGGANPPWPNGPAGHTTHCYMGNDALGCRATRTDMQNTRAQRILHGGFRKVADITGIQIMNLFHVAMAAGQSEAEAIARCRYNCQSNTFCSVWQFLRSNESDAGCWLETGPNPMLVENGVKKNSADAKNMIAGERIARTCLAPPSEVSLRMRVPGLSVFIVAVLLTLIALAVYFLKSKKKEKKSRAVKIDKPEPEVEAPLVPMFAPQPVTYQYIVAPAPQQQVVYTQAPQMVCKQPMVIQQAPQVMQPEVMYQAVPATAPAGSVVM